MAENVRTRERVEERVAVKQETKKTDAAGICPHCGAALDRDDYEFCPHCGGKLVDYCTFCGAPMSPEDIDCPECGMPADGVICPNCGARNLRSFCKECGQPVSRAARKAVEKAKQDVHVQEAARLMVHLSELQAELDALEDGGDDAAPEGPTEGELRLRELMEKVGFKPAEKPKVSAKKTGRSREEIMAEYRQAVEDANKVMEQMLPPAGMTPQEQRNYCTSRKVAMMEIMEEKWYGIRVCKTMGWECNRCHVLHRCPEECAVREFGGKWVTCTECDVVPEGTPGAELFTSKVEKKVYKRES